MAYQGPGDNRRAIASRGKAVDALQGEYLREYFGQTGIPAAVYRTLIATSLAELGAFPEGILRGEEGVSIAEAADHPFSRIMAYWGVGYLYRRKGELRTAIHVLEGGLQLYQVANIPVLVPQVAPPLGAAYARVGRAAEAMPLLEQAVEQAASMRRMGSHSLRLVCLGEVYLSASRMDEAITQALGALELSRTHKERGNEAWALRLLGAIALHDPRSDVVPAEDYYRQALALAEELDMRPLLAHCHRGLGTLY